MTPPLPSWIRNAHVDGYVNVYRLCPGETRLYGTESLYGDWGGQVLALAQDFYPSSWVEERLAAGFDRPYSHNPRAQTNVRLAKLTEGIRTGDHPEGCDILFGSALACLLRTDGKKRASLPNKREALRFGARTLEFVVERMPNLRAVVCLGRPAWDAAAPMLGARADRQELMRLAEPCRIDGLRVFAAPHPVSSVTNVEKRRVWEAVARSLG